MVMIDVVIDVGCRSDFEIYELVIININNSERKERLSENWSGSKNILQRAGQISQQDMGRGLCITFLSQNTNWVEFEIVVLWIMTITL